MLVRGKLGAAGSHGVLGGGTELGEGCGEF
ncbi:MAG: hypothetical protein RI897_2650 [Verrucomicrobiota bacterium]